MNWTEHESAQIISWLNEQYFGVRQFGSTTKAEIELFLFSVYLDHLIDNKEVFDDYTVGKQLHISMQKVRNLKEKKQLMYPKKDYYWVDAFVKCIENARYDPPTQLVKVTIPDVNVLKDVRHFLESNGWYDEYQLNPRLFQCKLDVFSDLCSKLPDHDGNIATDFFNDEVKKALMEKSKAKSEEEQSLIASFVKGSFKDGMRELGKNATVELIDFTLSLIPFGSVAKSAFHALSGVIAKTLK